MLKLHEQFELKFKALEAQLKARIGELEHELGEVLPLLDRTSSRVGKISAFRVFRLAPTQFVEHQP